MNTAASSSRERYSITLFLILTPLLGIAIALFAPLSPLVVVFMVAFVPTLMAILLTAIIGGRHGVATLLRKLIQWRVSAKWYAVALGLPLGIQLAMSLLALLVGWIPAIKMNASPTQLVFGVAILILAVLEELGWRGYALPGLLAKRSVLVSALLIGVSWGAFHLGLGVMESRPLIPTFLAPFGASVAFTWLFIQTRGSLAMAILFHFGLNYFTFFSEGMTVEQVVWSQAIVSLALALVLILLFGADLQRRPAKTREVASAGHVETE
jgi:membrane protease YdiL (CAAX protease family)